MAFKCSGAAILVGLFAAVGSSAAARAQDVAAGETVFKQKCRICHQIGDGAANIAGPTLNGLIGRKAGTIADYDYSDANKTVGLVWDEASFKDYIANPKAKIPGTKMIFAGLPKANDRDSLFTYLAQLDAEGHIRK